MSQLERQMRHRDKEMIPKILVQAMFALMIGSLALVAYAQWFDVPNRGVVEETPIVQSRSVILAGDRSGAYEVRDVDGALLASSSDERGGFISVIGRVVDRSRHVRDLPMDVPIQVVLRESGHYAIIDDTSDLKVELIGYGADNVAAFAQLLD
ncbi:MAG: photosynthetic complex assembly protein PuhC [Pseudomonadota bacterium]